MFAKWNGTWLPRGCYGLHMDGGYWIYVAAIRGAHGNLPLRAACN